MSPQELCSRICNQSSFCQANPPMVCDGPQPQTPVTPKINHATTGLCRNLGRRLQSWDPGIWNRQAVNRYLFWGYIGV